MSTENVRNLVHLFEECHTRIQTLGELLLISCKPRPVFVTSQDLELTHENFVRFRDRVISNLNKMCILSKDISSQIHSERLQVEKQLNQPLVSLSVTMVTLTQLCCHIAYLMAINTEGSQPATLGPVASQFELVQADLELKFVCGRLKRSHVYDLTPHVLVDMCATITKSLSCIADMCKDAVEKITDTQEQDQFKLCVKAITSTTGCLVSSVKSLKSRRQQQQQQHHHHHQHGDTAAPTTSSSSASDASAESSHLQRVVNFCLPMTATSSALTAFATEDKFLGSPASLSPVGENVFKSILGLCMSMLSASVQIIKGTRDLLHDPTKRKHKERISLCVDSISRTAFRLRDFLLSYEFAASAKISPLAASTTVTTAGGDDRHIAVIKDGEISTSFHFDSNNSGLGGGGSGGDSGKRDENKEVAKASPGLKGDAKLYNDNNNQNDGVVIRVGDKKLNSTSSLLTSSSLPPSSSSSSSSPSSSQPPTSISATSVINNKNINDIGHNNDNNINVNNHHQSSSSSLPLSKSSPMSPSLSPASSPKLSSKSKSTGSSSTSDSKKKHHHHHHRKSSSSSSSKQFSIPTEPGYSSYAGAQSQQMQTRINSPIVAKVSPTQQQPTKESTSSQPSASSPQLSPLSSAASPQASSSSSSSPSNVRSSPSSSSSASSSNEPLDPSTQTMKEEFVLSVDVLGDIVQSERL